MHSRRYLRGRAHPAALAALTMLLLIAGLGVALFVGPFDTHRPPPVPAAPAPAEAPPDLVDLPPDGSNSGGSGDPGAGPADDGNRGDPRAGTNSGRPDTSPHHNTNRPAAGGSDAGDTHPPAHPADPPAGTDVPAVSDPVIAPTREIDYRAFDKSRNITPALRELFRARAAGHVNDLAVSYRDARLIGQMAQRDLALDVLRRTPGDDAAIQALQIVLDAPGNQDASAVASYLTDHNESIRLLAWSFFATRSTDQARRLAEVWEKAEPADRPAWPLALAVLMNHPQPTFYGTLIDGALAGRSAALPPRTNDPAVTAMLQDLYRAAAWSSGARLSSGTRRIATDDGDFARALKREVSRRSDAGLQLVRGRLTAPDWPDQRDEFRDVFQRAAKQGELRDPAAEFELYHGVVRGGSPMFGLSPTESFRQARETMRYRMDVTYSPGSRWLDAEGLCTVPACVAYAFSHPPAALDATQQRSPMSAMDPGIDDVRFLCSLRDPALGPVIEAIGLATFDGAPLPELRRTEPLVARRVELVRSLCAAFFASLGRTVERASADRTPGVAFCSRMLAQLDERSSVDDQLALYRCAIALDDATLVESLLAMPAVQHNIFWSAAVTSLTRHTFSDDDQNADSDRWLTWLRANAPLKKANE
ncbi:MAG: hypothetical protein AB7K09_17760 [Planctomycetota bacterium]